MYIGGGFTATDNQYIVMAYHTSSGQWITLPPYRTRWFSLITINNHLVLVGGEGHDGYATRVLSVWREDSKEWTCPYPDMTTPRHSCSVVRYKQWLTVAGGSGSDDRELSSVEVMNTETKQWYIGPPTPVAWDDMKATIAGDTCYYMGGCIEVTGYTTKVYSVYLPALISQLNADSSTTKDTQIWKELPRLPVTRAAPLSLRGSLLAVGGRKMNCKCTVSLPT